MSHLFPPHAAIENELNTLFASHELDEINFNSGTQLDKYKSSVMDSPKEQHARIEDLWHEEVNDKDGDERITLPLPRAVGVD